MCRPHRSRHSKAERGLLPAAFAKRGPHGISTLAIVASSTGVAFLGLLGFEAIVEILNLLCEFEWFRVTGGAMVLCWYINTYSNRRGRVRIESLRSRSPWRLMLIRTSITSRGELTKGAGEVDCEAKHHQ